MSGRTMFLVRRFVVYGNGEGYQIPYLDEDTHCCSDVPTRWHPCSIHPTRPEAEAEASRRNREARAALNPHWLRGCLDSLPEVPVGDFGPLPDLAVLGVRPPPPETIPSRYGDYESDDNVARWFDEQETGWPPDVREAVWLELALNVGFYDVVEIELTD